MADIITAIALAVALEGALYAISPKAMKKFMTQVLDQPDNILRGVGMAAVITGVVCIWLVRI